MLTGELYLCSRSQNYHDFDDIKKQAHEVSVHTLNSVLYLYNWLEVEVKMFSD